MDPGVCVSFHHDLLILPVNFTLLKWLAPSTKVNICQ